MILSIIIPVYHVERTLDRCVEGVLRHDVTLMYVSSTKATRDSLLLAMRA